MNTTNRRGFAAEDSLCNTGGQLAPNFSATSLSVERVKGIEPSS